MQRFLTRIEQIKIRRNRRLTLSVLTLVAVFGFIGWSSNRAEASCGDYLSHHGIMGYAPMPGSEHPMNGNPHRRPCNGPSCQQAPLQLPPSTPVVSFELQDRWNWMASIGMPMLDQTAFLTRLVVPVALPMIAYRLDRPPKV